MASPLIVPVFQFPAAAGVNTSGYRVNTYAAGTSSPLATYTDSTLAVANANPVVMNANGEANIWLGSALYKFVGTDTVGNVLWTVDNVSQGGVGSGASEWSPIAGVAGFLTATTFSATVDPVNGSSSVGSAGGLTIGTRLRYTTGSGTGYATVTNISAAAYPAVSTVTIKTFGPAAFDNTLTAMAFGFIATSPTSLVQFSRVIAGAGGNINMVNATPTKLTGTAETVDSLDEFTGDTFTCKFPGTFRIFGTVLFNENAATTGIANVAQSVLIRKNGAAQITLTINWPVANSIASTQAIPFNGTFTLALTDTVDIAVTATFTATAPTASLASLNIERVL